MQRGVSEMMHVRIRFEDKRKEEELKYFWKDMHEQYLRAIRSGFAVEFMDIAHTVRMIFHHHQMDGVRIAAVIAVCKNETTATLFVVPPESEKLFFLSGPIYLSHDFAVQGKKPEDGCMWMLPKAREASWQFYLAMMGEMKKQTEALAHMFREKDYMSASGELDETFVRFDPPKAK
ncbi:MAG: hypothetical protein AAB581_00350 [Patescibacteria group bacterium]